jgi:hypothetical protein
VSYSHQFYRTLFLSGLSTHKIDRKDRERERERKEGERRERGRRERGEREGGRRGREKKESSYSIEECHWFLENITRFNPVKKNKI